MALAGIQAMGIAADVGTKATQRYNIAAQTELAFAQRENTIADTANKYAELEMKFQDIAERDMQIDVLERAQAGRLAQADLFTDKNIALLQQSEKIKQRDALEISNALSTEYLKLQQQTRMDIASKADQVNSRETHAQLYREVEQAAAQVGLTPDNFGLSKEWDPIESTKEWKMNQNSAIATQSFLQAQSDLAQKHRNTMERDSKLDEYNIDSDVRQLQRETWITRLNNAAAAERARVQASKNTGTPISRASMSKMSPADIESNIERDIRDLTNDWNWTLKDSDTKDLISAGPGWIKATVDEYYNKYRKGEIDEPIGDAQAIPMYYEYITERIYEGDFSKKAPRSISALTRAKSGSMTDAEKEKVRWTSIWLQNYIQANPEVAEWSMMRKNGLKDQAWRMPSERFK